MGWQLIGSMLLGAAVTSCGSIVTTSTADGAPGLRGTDASFDPPEAGTDASALADAPADVVSDAQVYPTPIERCPLPPAPLAPAAREPSVVSMSLSSSHECAVYRDGTARCRGLNTYGQIGAGTLDDYFAQPTEVVGLRSVRQIAVSFLGTTMALLGDGTVRVWGDNQRGDLGTTEALAMCRYGACAHTPVALPGLDGVEAIVNGSPTMCALRRDRSAWCWGLSPLGVPGSRLSTPTRVDAPGEVEELIDVVLPAMRLRDGSFFPEYWREQLGSAIPAGWAIAPGSGWHLCARLPDGTVRCWGYNRDGKVGDGTAQDREGMSPVPRDPGLDCVSAVARGNQHTCAIRTDRSVWCWGRNDYEQAGVPLGESDDCSGVLGAARCVLRPRRVEGIDHVEAVFLGYSRSCAIRSDRTVWCWGDRYGASAHSSRPALSDW